MYYIKLFLWIFRAFMGFFRILKTKFFSLIICFCKALAVNRTVDRTRSPSTGAVDRTCTQTCTQPAPLGRSTERSTD